MQDFSLSCLPIRSRSQLADKFLTLGVLKQSGARILTPSTRTPVVCTLKHIPRSEQEVDEIFGRSHVIVTTSHVAGQCNEAVQRHIVHHCPYFFIDEAHHEQAPTWATFKSRFAAARIVQFTATPFREDGKPLDGRIIFKYPLAKAQAEGYFQPITFVPVVEFNPLRVDEAIADAAVAQLRHDLARGHILMARVDSVSRAEAVFHIYSRFPEFNPVQLHTGIKSVRDRERVRGQVISGTSRIVVCVDMLGEGFDLPTLKIAAFHDIRKTLAVTLSWLDGLRGLVPISAMQHSSPTQPTSMCKTHSASCTRETLTGIFYCRSSANALSANRCHCKAF